MEEAQKQLSDLNIEAGEIVDTKSVSMVGRNNVSAALYGYWLAGACVLCHLLLALHGLA